MGERERRKEEGGGRWEVGGGRREGGRSRFPPSGLLVVRDVRPI